jgi:hypothetical protein
VLRGDVDDICGRLGYYAALSGSSVPTFRDNLSVPFSKAQEVEKKAVVYFKVSSKLLSFRVVTMLQEVNPSRRNV